MIQHVYFAATKPLFNFLNNDDDKTWADAQQRIAELTNNGIAKRGFSTVYVRNFLVRKYPDPKNWLPKFLYHNGKSDNPEVEPQRAHYYRIAFNA
jgi:hypothetical protein